MFTPINFTIFTILIYLTAAVTGFCGMVMRKDFWKKTGCCLACGAFFCQTAALVLGLHSLGGLTFGAYLQMLAWFLLLCGIAAWWRLGHEAIILFAAPAGLILFILSIPSLNTFIKLPDSLTLTFYALHIGSLFLSLGLLGLGFIAAAIFLYLQKRIKSRKKMGQFWGSMPALAMLDKINSAVTLLVFPLYTLGLATGLGWARPVFGEAYGTDAKIITSLIIWTLIAALFHNRLAKAWKGRKPALLLTVIFLLSIFSISIVNFFFPTHHLFTA